MTAVAMLTAVCVSAQRQCESLNFGWEFRLNDEGDWRKVDVPHDFQIEMPWAVPANTDAPASPDPWRAEDSRLWLKAATACTTPRGKR